MPQPPHGQTGRQLPIGPLSFVVVAGAGLLLVWCSYLFEVHAISVLLLDFGQSPLFAHQDWILAQGVAAGLNLAKIALSIVVAERIVAGYRTLGPQLGRLLVFALSIMLVLVVFGSETISPHARATYDARLAEVDRGYRAAVEDLDQRTDARVAETAARFATERDEETASARVRLAALQQQLDVERGVGGQKFRGAKYLELERLIAEGNAALATSLDQLRRKERDAIAAIETERQQGQAALDTARDHDRAGIDLARIASSPEAQHPAVVAFARIMAKLSGREMVDPILITVAMSLLMTLALELLPMLLLTHAFRAVAEARAARAAPATATAETAADPAPDRLQGAGSNRPHAGARTGDDDAAPQDPELRIAA